MVDVVTDPRAARVFWTRRGSLRYVEQHRPPAGPELSRWLRVFWRDQAERGMQRAIRMQILAVTLSILALALVVLRAVLS